MIKSVAITKMYENGNKIEMRVDSNDISPNDKYYDKFHTGCDVKEIIESFNDLCKSQEWD